MIRNPKSKEDVGRSDLVGDVMELELFMILFRSLGERAQPVMEKVQIASRNCSFGVSLNKNKMRALTCFNRFLEQIHIGNFEGNL